MDFDTAVAILDSFKSLQRTGPHGYSTWNIRDADMEITMYGPYVVREALYIYVLNNKTKDYMNLEQVFELATDDFRLEISYHLDWFVVK